MEKLKIRIAAPEDAEAIAEIYRPYVEETAVSFEYTAPPAEEMRSRMLRTLENYPYLVAELSGRAAGLRLRRRLSAPSGLRLVCGAEHIP